MHEVATNIRHQWVVDDNLRHVPIGGVGSFAVQQLVLEIVQVEIDILKCIEEKDADDDGGKTAEVANHILNGHRLPFLVENGRGDEHKGGEEDVVDGRDDGGVEDVKCLIKVVHLNGDGDDDGEEENPEEGPRQLAVPVKGLSEADAEAFAGDHGEGADDGADADVDEDVGVAVARHKDHNEQRGAEDDQHEVGDEEWLRQHVRYVVQRVHLALLRGVEDDDSGADDGESAAQLRENVQVLLQVLMRQEGADENAESAQRSDQRGRRKGVRGKVGQLADAH